MREVILCKRCGQRRARRACPALHADICNICCGTEREVSISCPLECGHLQQAHLHEKPLPVNPKDLAEPAVEVSEGFLKQHEGFLLFSMHALLQAAVRTSGAVDTDVIEALDALIKTHRTEESGLIYETRPQNSVAAAVQQAVSDSLADYRKLTREREGLARLRSKDVLGVLIFLRRFGQQNLNGRPRGRFFLNLLRVMTPSEGIDERAPSIIL